MNEEDSNKTVAQELDWNDFTAPKKGESFSLQEEAWRYALFLMHGKEKSPEMVMAIAELLRVLLY